MSRLGSQFPVTAGVEAAGIVEKLGAKVDGVAIGERVAFANVGSGELNRCRGAYHTRFFVCLFVCCFFGMALHHLSLLVQKRGGGMDYESWYFL